MMRRTLPPEAACITLQTNGLTALVIRALMESLGGFTPEALHAANAIGDAMGDTGNITPAQRLDLLSLMEFGPPRTELYWTVACAFHERERRMREAPPAPVLPTLPPPAVGPPQSKAGRITKAADVKLTPFAEALIRSKEAA